MVRAGAGKGLGTAGQGGAGRRRAGRKVQDRMGSATQRKAGQGWAGAGQVCVRASPFSLESLPSKCVLSLHRLRVVQLFHHPPLVWWCFSFSNQIS